MLKKSANGFGKSLIYQAPLLVYDHITIETFGGHIVVIVSLLISLNEHQVNHLIIIGAGTVNVSSQADINSKSLKDMLVYRVKIEKGLKCIATGNHEGSPRRPAINQFVINYPFSNIQ